MPVSFLPSPARSLWYLGPVPLRLQALCVITGILTAIWLADRSYRKAGGEPDVMVTAAAWAVTAGLIPAAVGVLLAAARSSFGTQTGLWHALRVADATLGFPGAMAFGLAGLWLAGRRYTPGPGARRRRWRRWRRRRAIRAPAPHPLAPGQVGLVLGAAAPALMTGHAIATLANWTGQQGYGRPSSLWWAVKITPDHRLPGFENYATFQPVFLYQLLWDLAMAGLVILATRRFSLSGPRAFALAAAGYAAGGVTLGLLRMGQLPPVLGIRAGELGDGALLIVAVGYLIRTHRSARPRIALRPLESDSSGDVIST
jgi:prolipoprotein diacylglyceryltransferase